jgi:hypothetical protein
MIQDDEVQEKWVGNDLFDFDGTKIGRVEAVRALEDAAEPQWLVVEAGLATKLLVPAGQVRRSSDKLTFMHSRERVERSPLVADVSAPTPSEKGRLCRYYGLQYLGPEGGEDEGCFDMTDVRPAG